MIQIMRKILCLFGFLLFSLFTYWQFNDITQYHTQPLICYLWIASYTYIALLSLTCAFRKLPDRVFWISAAIPLVIALFRFAYIDWSYGNVLFNPNNPAANETGGLLVMIAWLLMLRKINTKDLGG